MGCTNLRAGYHTLTQTRTKPGSLRISARSAIRGWSTTFALDIDMFLLDIAPSTRPSPFAMSRDAFEERARATHTEVRLVLALANCLAAEHTGWVFAAAASASLQDCRIHVLVILILCREPEPEPSGVCSPPVCPEEFALLLIRIPSSSKKRRIGYLKKAKGKERKGVTLNYDEQSSQ